MMNSTRYGDFVESSGNGGWAGGWQCGLMHGIGEHARVKGAGRADQRSKLGGYLTLPRHRAPNSRPRTLKPGRGSHPTLAPPPSAQAPPEQVGCSAGAATPTQYSTPLVHTRKSWAMGCAIDPARAPPPMPHRNRVSSPCEVEERASVSESLHMPPHKHVLS